MSKDRQEQLVLNIAFNRGFRHTQLSTIRSFGDAKSDASDWNDDIERGEPHFEVTLLKYVADVFLRFPDEFNKSRLTEYVALYRLSLSEIYTGTILFSLHQMYESIFEDAATQKDALGIEELATGEYPTYDFAKRLDVVFDLKKLLSTYMAFKKKNLKAPFLLKDPLFYFHSLISAIQNYNGDEAEPFKEYFEDEPHFLDILAILHSFEKQFEPYTCNLFRLVNDQSFQQQLDLLDHQHENRGFSIKQHIWNGAANHPQFRKNLKQKARVNEYFLSQVVEGWMLVQ